MFKHILVCLDNSPDSLAAATVSARIAQKSGSALTGLHVYAARLHEERFLQMETTLGAAYGGRAHIERQRAIHAELITKGLEIIADLYTKTLKERHSNAKTKKREGKNYEEIIKELKEGGYDLAVLGACGLGKTPADRLGSVSERVVRGADTDSLVLRAAWKGANKILVAIDGSAPSFSALEKALALARIFALSIELASVYDPDYHRVAFRSIAGVLGEKEAALFRFREQEKLHEEIIDKNLAILYQRHLDRAEEFARRKGFSAQTTLLCGKPYAALLSHIGKTSPFILALGKKGFHSAPDMGGTALNCLREAPANVFISAQ